jgi:hypothetical protein
MAVVIKHRYVVEVSADVPAVMSPDYVTKTDLPLGGHRAVEVAVQTAV